jgi:hypothetical protein
MIRVGATTSYSTNFMKTRRNTFKIATAAIVAATTGIGNAGYVKTHTVQPILQDILQTQTLPGPVGLSFLLRYKDDPQPTNPVTIKFEKKAIETQCIEDFIKFDRAEFRKILNKVATKQSHELTCLWIMSLKVCSESRRGFANIFVCNPSDQKYVEDYNAQHLPFNKYNQIIVHPDVPKNYALAVYKGEGMYDGAGVFCPVKDAEKSRAGVWTPDLDKYMILGRIK